MKKAFVRLSFSFNDMGDSLAGACLKGPEGEDIVFDVKKGAGAVSVEVYVEYNKSRESKDPGYYEKLFDSVVDHVSEMIGDEVMRSEISYT